MAAEECRGPAGGASGPPGEEEVEPGEEWWCSDPAGAVPVVVPGKAYRGPGEGAGVSPGAAGSGSVEDCLRGRLPARRSAGCRTHWPPSSPSFASLASTSAVGAATIKTETFTSSVPDPVANPGFQN